MMESETTMALVNKRFERDCGGDVHVRIAIHETDPGAPREMAAGRFKGRRIESRTLTHWAHVTTEDEEEFTALFEGFLSGDAGAWPEDVDA